MPLILEPCKLCLQVIPLDPQLAMRSDVDATAVVKLSYRGYMCRGDAARQNANWFSRNLSAVFNDVPYLRMQGIDAETCQVLSSGDFKNGTLGSMPQIFQVMGNARAYGIPAVIQPNMQCLTEELRQLCNFLRKDEYHSMLVGFFEAIRTFALAHGSADVMNFEVSDWLPFRSTISLDGSFTCFTQADPARIGGGFTVATPL